MNSSKKGFTLVELMVVIAIIAILAVGSITGYSAYIKKARDNTRTTELRAVDNAIKAYSVDNGGNVPYDNSTPANAAALTAVVVDDTLTNINGEGPLNVGTTTEYLYGRCTDDATKFVIAVSLEAAGTGGNDNGGTAANGWLEIGNVDVADCGGLAVLPAQTGDVTVTAAATTGVVSVDADGAGAGAAATVAGWSLVTAS